MFAKNEVIQEKIYRVYDTAVAKTISEIMDHSSYYDTIRLSGFDRKNKEHLFVLRTALMIRDLYQAPVEIAGSWWDGVVINWKIHKNFEKIKIVNRFASNHIWVPSLIGKIKSEVKTETGVCLHLDDVYDTYYEGSCD